jgi:hypothetical protein
MDIFDLYAKKEEASWKEKMRFRRRMKGIEGKEEEIEFWSFPSKFRCPNSPSFIHSFLSGPPLELVIRASKRGKEGKSEMAKFPSPILAQFLVHLGIDGWCGVAVGQCKNGLFI